ALLARGDGVLRFTSAKARCEAEAGAADGLAFDVVQRGAGGDGFEHRFFHVAFDFQKPFSPTVVELERDPSRDLGEVLGASPIQAEDPKMFWRSLWEMIGSLGMEVGMTISFWQLVSRPRQVANVEPWKLYVSRQTPEVDPPPIQGKDDGAESSSELDKDGGETTESAGNGSDPLDADGDGGGGERGDAHSDGGHGGEGEHDDAAADIEEAVADVFVGPPLPPPPEPPPAAPLGHPVAALGGGVAAGPKHLGKTPAEITVRHRSGIIRYYDTTRAMVAQCLVPSHQGESSGCFLTRVCRDMKSNKARGRCLGLMRAWLGVSDETGITRWDHVHAWKPDHAERRDARREALASGDPSFRALAEKERVENDGDVD
ncbi:unnamed protein product, partial [Prorocentrum cordatum]